MLLPIRIRNEPRKLRALAAICRLKTALSTPQTLHSNRERFAIALPDQVHDARKEQPLSTIEAGHFLHFSGLSYRRIHKFSIWLRLVERVDYQPVLLAIRGERELHVHSLLAFGGFPAEGI